MNYRQKLAPCFSGVAPGDAVTHLGAPVTHLGDPVTHLGGYIGRLLYTYKMG